MYEYQYEGLFVSVSVSLLPKSVGVVRVCVRVGAGRIMVHVHIYSECNHFGFRFSSGGSTERRTAERYGKSVHGGTAVERE